MHPILFQFGRITIYSWGVTFVVSFLAALVFALRRTPRFGISVDHLLELSIVVVSASFVGSRAWYVLNHVQEFQGRWLKSINPFHDGQFGFRGLAMNGGVVLVLAAAFLWAWYRKVNFVAVGDLAAPGFLLAETIQRMFGCFMSGCCFGRPTTSGMGVMFPPEAPASQYFPGSPLWPTQLMTALCTLTGFVIILWLERRCRFPGAAFWSTLTCYAVIRLLIDQFRYYEPAQIMGSFGGLTFNTNHPILLGVLMFSAILWVRGYRKALRERNP
jgi:phosphatidylglycerol---prolipoprotein diacylglyceryl transferase